MTLNSQRLWHYFSFFTTYDLKSSGLCLDRGEKKQVLGPKNVESFGGTPPSRSAFLPPPLPNLHAEKLIPSPPSTQI